MRRCSFRGIALLHLFLVGVLTQVVGQQIQKTYWYFGENTRSLEFQRPNFDPQRVTIDNVLGPGGGAVATDPVKGELWFYTDGVSVYNTEGVIINPGTPLNGSLTRNQGTVIAHNPADTDGSISEVLIFTINDAGNISYSKYDNDIALNTVFPLPADGNLSTPINDTAGLPATTLSEGMVIIPNADRSGFWLITHNFGLDTYNITLVDDSGVLSTTTIDIPGSPTDVANMSYHEPTNRIAVSPAGAENIIILNIDPATGDLTDSGIDLTSLDVQSVYDIDFIGSGDSIYVSGNARNLGQELIRVSLVDIPPTPEVVLTTDIVNSYGLQYGPDSILYHLYEDSAGEYLLGSINLPDTSDINQVVYDPEVFAQGNGNSFDFQARQFPTFFPEFDLIDAPTFTVDATCTNVPGYFFHETPTDVDSVFWDFGDGIGTSTLIDPIYTYTTAGTFDVTLTVFVNGVSETSTPTTVDISDFSLTVSIDPTQQYWCDFPVEYTATAEGATTIRWSNQTPAEANALTEIAEPGTYYVVATDATTGCEAYMEQQVFEYGSTNTYANAWYFGNNAGIDFNPLFDQDDPDFGTIQPIPPGDADFLGGNLIDDAPEGFSIYCDAGGTPIVYSDGVQVFNRDNIEIESDLGGSNDATQSVYIMEKPDDATIYYIFFTEQVPNGSYEFSYAVFDLKASFNGVPGGGDLVRGSDNSPIITTLHECNTERITGNANWVITHEFGNNNFRAYPVTGAGIGRPVTSNVGSIHDYGTDGQSAQGYMVLNEDRLAVALSLSDNENYVEVFSFNSGSGAVAESFTLDLTSETGQVYGVGLANENVFATLRNVAGGGTKVFWWNIIDNSQTPPTQYSQTSIDSTRLEIFMTDVSLGSGDLGAMQIGPDGVMYIAHDGAPQLASIGNPDAEPVSVTDLDAFNFTLQADPDLSGGTSRLGLPNFVDFNGSSSPATGLLVANGCAGTDIPIVLTNPLDDSTQPVETYQVLIFNETGNQVAAYDGDDDINEVFNTLNAGAYEAILYINGCGVDQEPQTYPFTVEPLPVATLESVTQPTGCGQANGSAVINITSTGTITYFVTGPVTSASTTINAPQSGLNINNLSAGTYSVTLTNDITGCVNSLDFNVDDPVPYDVMVTEPIEANCPDFGGGGNIFYSFTGTPPYPSTYNVTLVDLTNNTETILNNQSGDTGQILDRSAGDYTLTIEGISDGCIVTTSFSIQSPDDIAISTDETNYSVCGEDVITIPVTTDGVDPLEVYEIIGGVPEENQAANVSVNGTEIIVQKPSSGNGIYNYTIVAPGDERGPCTSSVDITVTFGNSSPSPYPTQFVVCPDEVSIDRNTVFLDNNPNGFQSVSWFTPSGELIEETTDGETNIPGITFSGDSILIQSLRSEGIINLGTFSVVLVNIEGCETETDFTIMEDCEARVNAPTAFTPNSSIGSNDTFVIFPFLVSNDEFEFLVFNRWGEMVFQTNDYDFMVNTGWNGGYDNDEGRPVQGGTYAYKVTFKSEANPEEGTKEQRGSILVIR